MSSRTRVGKHWLTRLERPICKLDLKSTVRSMIGNIKKLFLSKTEMQKKQVLQDPDYVVGVKGSCYILDTASCMINYKEISNVEGVKRNKEIFRQICKVTFKTFICHVKGVKGSVHIHTQYTQIRGCTAVASSLS